MRSKLRHVNGDCAKVACELFEIGQSLGMAQTSTLPRFQGFPEPADLWISARRTHLLESLVLLVQKFLDSVYFRFYEDLGLVGIFLSSESSSRRLT